MGPGARGGEGRIADRRQGEEGRRTKGATDVPPQHVVHDDPAFFVGLRLTDVWYRWCEADDGSGEATLWLTADDGASGATVEFTPDAERYGVEQYGPRALWDEVREAFLRWYELRRPPRSRFGLSVEDGRRWVWLDEPGRVVGG
ncbi:hypothetical protein [Streptomyces sp. NPDC046887]|uniref:hypothetical protein n=1 Tax=Streptomyces sp. NPDC046887 TaxID=3155472 RepID=UPI0033DF0A45